MRTDLPNGKYSKTNYTVDNSNYGGEVVHLLPGLNYKIATITKSYTDFADDDRDNRYPIYRSYPVGSAVVLNKNVFTYKEDINYIAKPMTYDENEETRSYPDGENLEGRTLVVRNCKKVVEALLFAIYYVTAITRHMKPNDPELPAMLDKKKTLENMFITGCTYEQVVEMVGKNILAVYEERSKEYNKILDEKRTAKENATAKRKKVVAKIKSKTIVFLKFIVSPIIFYKGIAKVYSDGRKAEKYFKMQEKERLAKLNNEKNNNFNF